MKRVHLASTCVTGHVAVKAVFPPSWKIETHNCLPYRESFGRHKIRSATLDCLNQLFTWPAIAIESGIVQCGKDYVNIACVLLRTRFGTFEAWSEPVKQDSADVVAQAVNEVCRQWRVAQESLPFPVIPATSSRFKGVSFLDIQHPLFHNSRNLTTAVRRLADRLLFDTVMVMDARGFLMCAEFAHEEYPIVMARKTGKLPNEEISVEYKKEYGTDTICVSKGTIKPGARVIVLDDIIATGGTMMAADELVRKAGGEVVAFIAPFALEADGKLMGECLGPRMRFVCTMSEAENGSTYDLKFKKHVRHNHLLTLAPPSLLSMTVTAMNVPVKWGRFHHSSNIWFDPTLIPNKNLYVFLDPSNHREMIDVLHILSILYRKDPKKIIVVIPFLEQATQDRVEYNGVMESVAEVDTLGKLIGKHTVLTFDLHAEQSRFAFYDLRFSSLVERLWKDFHLENPTAVPVFPDDGAAKRFGKMSEIHNPIVFRKHREGEKRIVKTDDKILPGTSYVVIDDLVRSGGTMRSVAQYLKDRGAISVNALFAHAPLEPKACANMAVFDDVWTSDSCPRLVPSEWIRIRVMDML